MEIRLVYPVTKFHETILHALLFLPAPILLIQTSLPSVLQKICLAIENP